MVADKPAGGHLDLRPGVLHAQRPLPPRLRGPESEQRPRSHRGGRHPDLPWRLYHPAPRASIGSADCSFEFDLCGWRSVNPSSGASADLRAQDWRLADKKENFGNIKDHTFNLETSGYAYFTTVNIQTKTWLASPRLEAEQVFCLQFWYAGRSTGSANLVVKRQFNNGTVGQLWQGGVSSDWNPVQVNLPSLDTQSVVIIEGNSDNGGFAVDDIKVNYNCDKGGGSCHCHFQLRSVGSSGDCSTRPVVQTTRTGALNTANVFSLLS